MSTAEDLLNGLNGSKYLEIDSDLRTIKIPAGFKILGVYNDKDVQRLYFKLNRYYNDVDLSEYDVSVNYKNVDAEATRFFVVDKEVFDDHIEFSWCVGRAAFLKKGDTFFNVCLRKIAEDGTVLNEFNTTVHKLKVLEGLEATIEQPTDDEKDYIQQFLDEVLNKFKMEFNSAETERSSLFNDSQNYRETRFNESQTSRSNEFYESQTERDRQFYDAQSYRAETFRQSESDRKEMFDFSQETNQEAFDEAQANRKDLFERDERYMENVYNNKMSEWDSEVDRAAKHADNAARDAHEAVDLVTNKIAELKQQVEAGEFNGKPFTFDYVVPSVDALQTIPDPKTGDFALINTDDVADPDNSKMFTFDGRQWKYLNDFSGTIGISVASLIQTQFSSESEGINVWTVTLTNGAKFNFQVRNGKKGDKGDPGDKGDTGDVGPRGRAFSFDYIVDTLPTTANEHEFAIIQNSGELYEYVNGEWKSVVRMRGDKGDGYTALRIESGHLKVTEVVNGVVTTKDLGKIVPAKGVDYWTTEDIAEIDSHISEQVEARVGKEYEVMDMAEFEALTEYEIDKLYMTRWQ